MMNPEVAVAIANESGMEPPSGTTVTARGTATGRAERRTEREKESHVRERAMATIAPGTDATPAGHPHHANPATVTLGQHTHGVTAAAPNRPLLAPPANQWAIRPTLPYMRLTDNPDGIGPPPAAPRTAFNPYHGRPTTVNLDQGLVPARRHRRDSVCSSNAQIRIHWVYLSHLVTSLEFVMMQVHQEGVDGEMINLTAAFAITLLALPIVFFLFWG
jgi:hypothetical protein